jgi:hypothetical protein
MELEQRVSKMEGEMEGIAYEFTKMIGEAMDYTLTRKADRDRIKQYMKYRLRELREGKDNLNGMQEI